MNHISKIYAEQVGGMPQVQELPKTDKRNMAVESFSDVVKAAASEGSDMIISIPPLFYASYHNAVSGKSKEEMTMDEYKHYLYNKISYMPVSDYFMNTFKGSVIMTQKGLARMKEDPEWEEQVMDMIRTTFTMTLNMPQPGYMLQIIGDSEENSSIHMAPSKKGVGAFQFSGDEKSWWVERHEDIMERLEEQVLLEQRKQAVRRYMRLSKDENGEEVSDSLVPSIDIMQLFDFSKK